MKYAKVVTNVDSIFKNDVPKLKSLEDVYKRQILH